jgi:hypothetical protein
MLLTKRAVFVSKAANGESGYRMAKMADILRRLGEDPDDPEYNSTHGMIALAQALLQSGMATGVAVLVDGALILEFGTLESERS